MWSQMRPHIVVDFVLELDGAGHAAFLIIAAFQPLTDGLCGARQAAILGGEAARVQACSAAAHRILWA